MKVKAILASLALIATITTASAVDITLSPVYSVVEVVRSALGTALSPFALTAGTTAGALQLQAKEVRSEAMDFLSDGESTDRLTASFNELRKIEGFEGKSNEDLAKLIILSL